MKETGIMKDIMLALSGVGRGLDVVRCFRNNIGALEDKRGRWVTYGVCNPGGSDLIGWRSLVISTTMVGERVAVFAAVEVKRPGERPTQDQSRFLHAVSQAGGIAAVANSIDSALAAFPST